MSRLIKCGDSTACPKFSVKGSEIICRIFKNTISEVMTRKRSAARVVILKYIKISRILVVASCERDQPGITVTVPISAVKQ